MAEKPGEEPDAEANEGVILRPDAIVLGDEALVGEAEFVDPPPPTRLTYELLVDEPYRTGGGPGGVLAAGTRVAVLSEQADHCRVVDADGLAVDVRRASLRELSEP